MNLWYGMICTGLGILIFMARTYARQASHLIAFRKRERVSPVQRGFTLVEEHSILFVTDPQL